MAKTSNKKQSNTILLKDTITCKRMMIGFECKICGETQELEAHYYGIINIFPVCDRCIKDLKDYVLAKRTTQL
jgi:hypothetical protein